METEPEYSLRVKVTIVLGATLFLWAMIFGATASIYWLFSN